MTNVVELQLTPEQKQSIQEQLGLYWDSVTLDRGLSNDVTAELFAADINLVFAEGRQSKKED